MLKSPAILPHCQKDFSLAYPTTQPSPLATRSNWEPRERCRRRSRPLHAGRQYRAHGMLSSIVNPKNVLDRTPAMRRGSAPRTGHPGLPRGRQPTRSLSLTSSRTAAISQGPVGKWSAGPMLQSQSCRRISVYRCVLRGDVIGVQSLITQARGSSVAFVPYSASSLLNERSISNHPKSMPSMAWKSKRGAKVGCLTVSFCSPS